MHQKELKKARAPAIWFRRHGGKASASKLGGLPTLPPGIEWPRQLQSGTPLHFLAQIDLSHLPPTPLERVRKAPALPKAGLLFFFADMVEEMLWDDNGGAFATTRVIFADHTGPERSPPDGTPHMGHPFGEMSNEYTKGHTAFTQAALEPHVIETFGGVAPFPDPSDTYAAAAQAAMVASVERAIGAPLPVFRGPDSWAAIKAENPREYLQEHSFRGVVRRELHCPQHQMLGVGKNIQGTAESAWADGTVLLLQIDSDRAVHEEFIFCDMGAAQFWIDAADLAAGRFDKAWGTTEGG
jgi:uncharacterized protein YwqG